MSMTSKTYSLQLDQCLLIMSRLILEKGFSISAEGDAQGFVITNNQPYNKKLSKHKKMKVHKQVYFQYTICSVITLLILGYEK